jgi:hypothetical protein
MTALEFPKHASELTPEFLTRVLAERHPEVAVADLRVVEEAHCDTGSVSTAARAVLDLDFAPSRDAGLPSRVILKTILVRCGAPGSLYENEVRFYREVRPELSIETPEADRLRSAGVANVPTAEAAWLSYRQTAIWGFVLGWLICPTENYGETILRANLDRLTAAIEDLETFSALAD